MNMLWALVALLTAFAVSPRLIGRSAANEPLLGVGDDSALLRMIRVAAIGTAAILIAIIYSSSN